MSDDEFSAVVPPGFGCSFESVEDLLVVASGPDDNTAGYDAAIKIGGEVIALTGQETGGFDALVDGGTFEGSGVTVRIARSGDGRQAGIETTAWDAHLEAERNGRRSALTGTWSCGA
jgi:S1-C subfamily serine protease